jgi:hypothetical protein
MSARLTLQTAVSKAVQICECTANVLFEDGGEIGTNGTNKEAIHVRDGLG